MQLGDGSSWGMAATGRWQQLEHGGAAASLLRVLLFACAGDGALAAGSVGGVPHRWVVGGRPTTQVV